MALGLCWMGVDRQRWWWWRVREGKKLGSSCIQFAFLIWWRKLSGFFFRGLFSVRRDIWVSDFLLLINLDKITFFIRKTWSFRNFFGHFQDEWWNGTTELKILWNVEWSFEAKTLPRETWIYYKFNALEIK